MYSQQHEVSTRWGHFLLDDGAYAAYLEGKLWISWGEGRENSKARKELQKPVPPVSVSETALHFRDTAARQEIYSFLSQHFPGLRIPVPYRSRMKDLSIGEMNLSVRSSNALMRANAGTFERVTEIMQSEDGFKKIRNLGAKSEKEIIRSFFCACYDNLTPGEQALFWQKVLDSRREPAAPSAGLEILRPQPQ